MIVQKLEAGRVIAVLVLAMALLAVVEVNDQQRAVVTPTRTAAAATPTPEHALTFIAPSAVPTARATPELAPYPIYGPAAEIRNEVWLNTETPARLAGLRGQVVLLTFFAYDCPPCMPVLGAVREWHDAYSEQGLQVIGIHYPRIEEERDLDNLIAALARLDVPYPVVQDNEGMTWNAYGQRVLPTIYLIDKRGFLRYRFVGVGGYDETEAAIRGLLDERS